MLINFEILDAGPIETHALIVGAGPVGLYLVHQLGLLGVRAHVIDSQPHVGGQCATLYPDQPIHDLPGASGCTARQLTDSLYAQTLPHGATFHLDQQVGTVIRQDDGRFYVRTSKQRDFVASTLFIAGGFGSFLPRRLPFPELERFCNKQVFHRVQPSERFRDQQVIIVGSGNTALQTALDLMCVAAKVTVILHDEPPTATARRLRQFGLLCDAGLIIRVHGQVVGIRQSDDRLSALNLRTAGGAVNRLPMDSLLVLRGLAPDLGPIAEWDLALQNNQLTVDIEKFETSTPGIFAVGDIAHYPGKRRHLLSGFHEASMAAQRASRRLFPERSMPSASSPTSSLPDAWMISPKGLVGSLSRPTR